MGLFDSLIGAVRVELTSADITTSLRAINMMRIPIHKLQIVDDLSAQFTVSRCDLKRIQNEVSKKGDNIKIFSKSGIFWWIWGLRQRPVFIIGILILFLMSEILPSRVLFVEVEGNSQIARNQILEAADSAGISFGTSRRNVKSEMVKNKLLAALPQLQWAGVNTYGCRAVISVRERTVEDEQLKKYVLSSMVASCDGIVTSVTVTSGTGNCDVGQAVQKGQLLISGYTDCGGIVTLGQAKGEIFAQTNHKITAVTPSENLIRTDPGDSKTYSSLCIGKKRINFYKGSGISDGSCVKMVTQYHLTLPGGYRLPLSLVVEEKNHYQTQINQIDRRKSSVLLCEFSRNLLRNEGVALEVLDAEERIAAENSLLIVNAVYNCTEMINRERGEQIGDFHGKTD